MMLLLQLLTAHFIADFWLQPDSWIVDKQNKKLKSSKLYYHILLHFLVTTLLVFDFKYLFGIIFITILHYIIDVLKLYIQNETNKRNLFVLDQFLHLCIIMITTAYYNPIIKNVWLLIDIEKLMVLVLCLLILTIVSSTFIKILISKWSPETEDIEEDSLAKAGSFIGKLERLFVFGFVVVGQLQAVGFLLAAKSVFRFGDLKDAKDRKLTEYILIGTLLSFGIAIVVGMIFSFVINYKQ